MGIQVSCIKFERNKMNDTKRPSQQDINRIIIGNQVLIMRSLAVFMRQVVGDVELHEALNLRVRDTKVWWRSKFDEEIGFSSSLGDGPGL
jgi:hypothetical protein